MLREVPGAAVDGWSSIPVEGHPSSGRRIILMDLNVALSENFSEMRRYPMWEFVSSVETFRQWMVELLRDEYTVIITARDIRWREHTLERLHEQTGWEPQEVWFNNTGISGAAAPAVKRQLVTQYVLPRHGATPGNYLAIESNYRTRQMYRGLGIRAIDCERESEWSCIPA